VKQAGAISICAVLLALGLPGSADAASRSGFVRCPDFTTHGVEVTNVRTNFGCRRARVVLRSLLKGGVSGLPAKTRRAGKWGCKRSGKQRVCTRYRTRRRVGRQVKFRAAAAKSGTPEPQPGPPPPVPVDPVQHCIGVWNAGGPTNSYGSTRLDGIHFYNDHHMREAWVFTIPNPTFSSVLRCQVVFVVPTDDPFPNEYGYDGEVLNPDGNGWQLMQNDRVSQGAAPQHANTTLASDGTLQKKG
jgi:hypothetical protein